MTRPGDKFRNERDVVPMGIRRLGNARARTFQQKKQPND